MRSLFKTIYDQHSRKQGALSAEEEERRKLRLVPEKQSCQVGMAVFDDSSSEIRFWIVTIVGKSDFVSGILILESIFPNFSEYFS